MQTSASLAGKYSDVQGGWCVLTTKKLHIWGSPGPHPMCSETHTILVLIGILYNKTMIISIVLSRVLWVIIVNYWTWERCENPWICSQLVRSAADLLISELVADDKRSLMQDSISLCLLQVVSTRIALWYCWAQNKLLKALLRSQRWDKVQFKDYITRFSPSLELLGSWPFLVNLPTVPLNTPLIPLPTAVL